jgi:hypothetical protein
MLNILLVLTDNKVSRHFPSGIVSCVSQGCLKLSKMKSNDLYPCFMILSCYVVPIDSRLIKIEILKALNLAMVKIVETDERITLEKQLNEDVGPIVVMNKFNVDPQEVDEFLQVFTRTTEKFKQ